MKKNLISRILGYFLIAVIYVFTLYCATVFYKKINVYVPHWSLKLLFTDIFATIVIFIFSCIFSNASIYDPYWSVQPIAISLCYIHFLQINSMGHFSGFAKLITGIICFWGIRLTLNWAYTFDSLKKQDWRYTMLKEKTKKWYPFVNFFGIHLVPTLIVYACSLPAVYVVLNYHIQPSILSFMFLLISVGSVFLQGIADIQMHKFRKNKKLAKETSTFIEFGLWKNARHPNYLAEIVFWWGIALAVICAVPKCFFFITGALLNTLLFVFVSVPLADGRQAKKDGFDLYKASTRTFLPFPKKNCKEVL